MGDRVEEEDGWEVYDYSDVMTKPGKSHFKKRFVSEYYISPERSCELSTTLISVPGQFEFLGQITLLNIFLEVLSLLIWLNKMKREVPTDTKKNLAMGSSAKVADKLNMHAHRIVPYINQVGTSNDMKQWDA